MILINGWERTAGCPIWNQRNWRWLISKRYREKLVKSNIRNDAPRFSCRRRQVAAPRTEQHDRHEHHVNRGVAQSSTKRHLPLAVHPGINLLVAGRLSHGGRAESELAPHSHILSFLLITVTAIYVVVDVEYPRAGLIRLGSFDQILVDVRAFME